jgi:hypothetical protein
VRRRVIDTNVPIVANGHGEPATVRSCIEALRKLRESGLVVLDDGFRIIQEYRRYLSATGQPGPGDAFFKWLWDNLYNTEHCNQIHITEHTDRGFCEFPDHPELSRFDPSDRKFVAVAAAHPERPPILQAADSKWIGFDDALRQCGVTIEFLSTDIHATFRRKMGR